MFLKKMTISYDPNFVPATADGLRLNSPLEPFPCEDCIKLSWKIATAANCDSIL